MIGHATRTSRFGSFVVPLSGRWKVDQIDRYADERLSAVRRPVAAHHALGLAADDALDHGRTALLEDDAQPLHEDPREAQPVDTRNDARHLQGERRCSSIEVSPTPDAFFGTLVPSAAIGANWNDFFLYLPASPSPPKRVGRGRAPSTAVLASNGSRA